MNVNKFKQKYSNEISNFEETTGKNAIWHNEFTNSFIDHLQEKNIKINFKPPKLLIPNRYNYLSYISKFWLKFLKKNTYFTKKRVIYEYIQEYKPIKIKYRDIEITFHNILRYFLKYGIIEHHSASTYKINKELVSQYSKNY